MWALALPALAARPVTPEEQEKLVAALAALGCTSGEMEFDDDTYEVEDAACNDGKHHNFEFDLQFRMTHREIAEASPALARRPLKADEEQKLVAALAALGCTGGEFEFYDDTYEVEEAACNDGKNYNFEFDLQFRMTHREPAVAP
jgi:hypothetical protein